ncbi:MAG: alkaline phosphatase family protein [Micropruina sp.]|nr:alkaline phosphatase family protein [Micropruina sp.]
MAGLSGENRLGLPTAHRYVVFLVDGLGWELLREAADHAPYLSQLAERGRAITSGVPSTTSTSITCLGTGLAPGQHGIAGYTFRFDQHLLNALTWEEGLSGLDVQPQLTYFERLVKAGVRASSVTPARFRRSGLTMSALRGPDFLDVQDESDSDRRIALTVQGATSAERTAVYLYERKLDHTGHAHGCASRQWHTELSNIDAFTARLRDALPDDVRLLITGDHGMVDIDPTAQILIEDEPGLNSGIALIGGEPRLRQLYVQRGQTGAVAARWRDRLGDDAWVTTREEATEAGWFGPMSPRLADRFGDVLVACRGPIALMSRTQPNELNLIGMHGSLTPAEMNVPLLVG